MVGIRSNYVHRAIAARISTMARYYDEVIQVLPVEHDRGALLSMIDSPRKAREETLSAGPTAGKRRAILINGTFNHSTDIQGILEGLRPRVGRDDRMVAVAYNPYLKFLFGLANSLGLRKGPLPRTFLRRVDAQELARLSGYELLSFSPCGYAPARMAGLGWLANRLLPLLPGIRWLAFGCVLVMRPKVEQVERLGLTVVIPARNEFGNIEAALQRMPDLGCPLEVIFVEGHSSDGTWEEIERVRRAYGDRVRILSAKQSGKGKADAVRLGFSMATMPLLTILDADLTMPPEMLRRFYQAYVEGHGDFINGSRLLYPMEGEAMRFLNHLGNVFFASSLSYVLSTRLGDSLCGTKLLARHDYERMKAWRRDFGDFDPFGDFELLFPAAVLQLGLVNLPIRYAARTYGSTNISRFRHGFELLRMTVIGFFRIKCR